MPNPNANKTVMVVDDDPYILDVMAISLKTKGFRVLCTTDPEKVNILAETEQPNLIISDIAMPGMDGFTLIKSLKDNPKTTHIPLVLLTGTDRMEDVEKGFAAGAQAYILKPIDWDRTWSKLQPLLG